MKKTTKEEVIHTVKRWIDENPEDRSVILMMAERGESGKPVCTHATFTDDAAAGWMLGDLFYSNRLLQYIAVSILAELAKVDKRTEQK